MSEPKELWEVARDASDLAMQCGKPYWSNIVDTVIAEHERRKADPYATLKAAAADPTKQIRMINVFGKGRHSDWMDSGYEWKFQGKLEDYEIRDKPKKVDWSRLSAHVRKYLREYEEQRFPSIWIPWGLPEFGDKCPVPEGVMVEIMFRNRDTHTGDSSEWRWRQSGEEDDIIAFRITGVNDQWEA